MTLSTLALALFISGFVGRRVWKDKVWGQVESMGLLAILCCVTWAQFTSIYKHLP